MQGALRLVLASKSPRRKEILEAAGLPFTVRSADVAEQRGACETPADYVRRLARSKAEAVNLEPSEVILGADTVVVLGDDVLEKPRSSADAESMLARLSGREHTVITGVHLRHQHGSLTDEARTRVCFAHLAPDEIRAYVASGEPMDKAGAYAIQGLASKFITEIEGCYFNVVGLPVAMVYRHLLEIRCGAWQQTG